MFLPPYILHRWEQPGPGSVHQVPCPETGQNLRDQNHQLSRPMLCSFGDTSGRFIIKNKWPVNHVLCEINVFLQYWVALVDINMFWVLNVYKLIWVRNPMNSRTRERSIRYILATSRLQEPYVGSIQHFPDPMYRSYRCAYLSRSTSGNGST